MTSISSRVARCQQFIQGLYRESQPMEDFFANHVARFRAALGVATLRTGLESAISTEEFDERDEMAPPGHHGGPGKRCTRELADHAVNRPQML
jgi:hypothetical protein